MQMVRSYFILIENTLNVCGEKCFCFCVQFLLAFIVIYQRSKIPTTISLDTIFSKFIWISHRLRVES